MTKPAKYRSMPSARYPSSNPAQLSDTTAIPTPKDRNWSSAGRTSRKSSTTGPAAGASSSSSSATDGSAMPNTASMARW
jgi:hypothetical protein